MMNLERFSFSLFAVLLAFASACGAPSISGQIHEETTSQKTSTDQTSGSVASADPNGSEKSSPLQMSPAGMQLLNDGVAAGARGDLTSAHKAFLQAASTDPHAPQPLYNLGVFAEREGNDAKAIEFYQNSLQKERDYVLAVSALSKLFIRIGQTDKAVQLTRQSAQNRPDNISLLVLYADALISVQKYEDAISICKKALRVDERSAPAMLRIGKANLKMGRIELAESVFDQVVAIDSNIPEVYFLQGLLEIQKGFRSLATQRFEKAVELNPFYPEALNNLAAENIYAGNYSEAIQHLERAISVSPSWGVLYLNYGNALRGAGRWQDAVTALLKAKEKLSDPGDVYFNLGVLYFTAGDFGGSNRLVRLQKSKEFFAKYKSEKGVKLRTDDDASSYIKELDTLIDREKVRQQRDIEMARREAERSQARETAGQVSPDATGNDDSTSTAPESGEEGWEDEEGWE